MAATFTVNGQTVTVQQNQKLLRYLRDTLRLTSVKDGCSEGACGTCTILLDGKPVKACVQQTDRLDGRHILTVEGLSDFEKEVYVYAFGTAGAVQCGFCIPGMVLCAKALLDVNPDPDEAAIRHALRNNICRCTGYVKIIEAVRIAAAVLRAGKIPKADGDWRLGARVPRLDVREKVLGTGVYTDDIELPGMLHASAVRSKYPRARVLAIHTERARALPGVACVLTADDIPCLHKVGHLKRDWDVMIGVGGITHYLGDAIALVAAETPEILEAAKALVEVEYEELPPVRSAQEAMAEDAPQLHEGGNLLAHRHVRRGDVAAAYSLGRGAAEALEIVAHGDRRSSKVVGRRIGSISLPEGCAIGALIRGNDENALVLMGDKDTVIEAEDHVIVFVPSKKLIPKIERLFTVNVGFF